MPPESAKLLRRYVEYRDGKFWIAERPVPLVSWYAAKYFEVPLKGGLYRIPAMMFAYFYYYNRWSEKAVFPKDGNIYNFDRENLKQRPPSIPAPQARFIRKLTDEEAAAVVERRAVRRDDDSTNTG